MLFRNHRCDVRIKTRQLQKKTTKYYLKVKQTYNIYLWKLLNEFRCRDRKIQLFGTEKLLLITSLSFQL